MPAPRQPGSHPVSQPSAQVSAARPITLGAHHLRLFALLIDYLLVVTALNLLDQLTMGAHWDLEPMTGARWTQIAYWAVGLTVLLVGRDLVGGRSPGKWFTGIAVGLEADPLRTPAAWRLLVRNALLALLPVEAVLVFVDPLCRRLGDRLAGTVVVAAPRPAPAGRRLLALAILMLAALLAAFLVGPWNLRRTAAYDKATALIRQRPEVRARVGSDPALSEPPRFDLRLEPQGGRAEVSFTVEGARGRAEGELTLRLDRRRRRWELAAFSLEPPPEERGPRPEVRDAPAPDGRTAPGGGAAAAER